MSKKILIIGATGMVGADLLKKIQETNRFSITATSRKEYCSGRNIKWLKFDANKSHRSLFTALEECPYIIINAGAKELGKSIEEIEILKKINIDFVTAISKVIKILGNKKIIYIGSLSVLRKPLDPVITESHECSPVLPYSISKYWAEKALMSINHINGCKVFVLRISSPIPSDFNVLADGLVVKKWINCVKQKIPFFITGTGERTQDYISAKDIASACLNALEATETGIFHIASGNQISMKRLAETIKKYFPSCAYSYQNVEEPLCEKWNISILKATKYLNFVPTLTSEEAITNLIKSIH